MEQKRQMLVQLKQIYIHITLWIVDASFGVSVSQFSSSSSELSLTLAFPRDFSFRTKKTRRSHIVSFCAFCVNWNYEVDQHKKQKSTYQVRDTSYMRMFVYTKTSTANRDLHRVYLKSCKNHLFLSLNRHAGECGVVFSFYRVPSGLTTCVYVSWFRGFSSRSDTKR